METRQNFSRFLSVCFYCMSAFSARIGSGSLRQKTTNRPNAPRSPPHIAAHRIHLRSPSRTFSARRRAAPRKEKREKGRGEKNIPKRQRKRRGERVRHRKMGGAEVSAIVLSKTQKNAGCNPQGCSPHYTVCFLFGRSQCSKRFFSM